MASAGWIKSLLEQKGVAFEKVDDRGLFTARGSLRDEPVGGYHVAKVAVALIDGPPVVLILPASRRVVLGRWQKLLGADDVRLASEDEMEGLLTDGATGASPWQRRGEDLELLLDPSLSSAAALVFEGVAHEEAIRFKLHAWHPVMGPRVESFPEPDHGTLEGGSSHREAAGIVGSTRAPEGRVRGVRREPGPEASRCHWGIG